VDETIQRLIQPGRFWMGSRAGEEGRDQDETLHEVVLTKPYYLASHPLTRGQFRKFIEPDGYRTDAEREGGAYGWTGSKWEQNRKFNWKNPGFKQDDDHPVVCVSHNDAVAFCAWLSKATGQTYGLPTEAQWEYACRAKALSSGGVEITRDAYHFGNAITPSDANYENNVGGTSKAGSYACNGFGLFDMHGNVWEWCADWYGLYSTAKGEEADPQGAPGGSDRVFRGGSWGGGRGCRAAARGWGAPIHRNSLLGFRLALVPSGAPPYNVILLNDDGHTAEYAISMMRQIFGYPQERCMQIAEQIHFQGRSIILTCSKELAELRQEQIHAFGPDPVVPHSAGSMSAVIEPST